MELIGIVIFIGIAGSVIWLFGKLLRASWILVTLPIRLLIVLLGPVFFLLIAPIALIAGVIGVLFPTALILLFLPVFLLGLGLSVHSRR
jgi:hypothetical protein